MTFKESYNYWKRRYELAKDFRDPHWECGEAREHREWCEHMKNAYTALEKAEKYRWHDLRKNPGDLPSSFLCVLVQTESNLIHIAKRKPIGYPCCDVPNYEHEWRMKSDVYIDIAWDEQKYGKIIKWKEIEPSEEVAE